MISSVEVNERSSPKFEYDDEDENLCVIEMRSDSESSQKYGDSMIDRSR